MEQASPLTHMWWLKIGLDILTAEVLPEEQGVSATYQIFQPRIPVKEREVSRTFGCGN